MKTELRTLGKGKVKQEWKKREIECKLIYEVRGDPEGSGDIKRSKIETFV